VGFLALSLQQGVFATFQFLTVVLQITKIFRVVTLSLGM